MEISNHYEMRYRLFSITNNYFDLISLVITASNEGEARNIAEHILQCHEFFDYEYLGFRYVNKYYRSQFWRGEEKS